MPAPRDTARDPGSISGSNTPRGGESSAVPYYYRPWYVTAAQEATASAGAGMFVDSIFYGLDSYKTHLQSRGGGPQQLGLTEIRGLFRGFLPVVASGSAPSFATFFALYEPIKTALQSFSIAGDGGDHVPPNGGGAVAQNSISVVMASMLCAVPASIVSVPSDVLKKRVVLGLESSVGSAIRHIWAADGARGLFVGWRANVIKDVPFAAVKMSLYEAILSAYVVLRMHAMGPPLPPGWETARSRSTGKQYYANRQTGQSTYSWTDGPGKDVTYRFWEDARQHVRDSLYASEVALVGLLSGGATAVMTCPLDVVNTRLKSLELGATTRRPRAIKAGEPAAPPRTLLATGRTIVEAEGVAALWRGVLPRILIIGLGSSFFWPAYHHVRGWLRRDE